jgi:hypothetical protein
MADVENANKHLGQNQLTNRPILCSLTGFINIGGELSDRKKYLMYYKSRK